MLPANPPTARTNAGRLGERRPGRRRREVDPDPADDDRFDHRRTADGHARCLITASRNVAPTCRASAAPSRIRRPNGARLGS